VTHRNLYGALGLATLAVLGATASSCGTREERVAPGPAAAPPLETTASSSEAREERQMAPWEDRTMPFDQGDVILEYRVRRPMTADFAYAFLEGGDVWVYSDVLEPDPVTGTFRSNPAGPEWRRVGQLGEDDRRELAAAMGRARVESLAPEPPSVRDTCIGGTEILWTFRVGRVRRHVRRIWCGPGTTPDLETLETVVDRLVDQARQTGRRAN
jgi:hypothetical protein